MLCVLGYLSKHFVFLQLAIDRAITAYKLDASAPNLNTCQYQVQLQQAPYPPYVIDPFYETAQKVMDQLVILAYLFIAPIITKDILIEKELKLKV